jgi:tetratricopeptide (TPR) repeat protein
MSPTVDLRSRFDALRVWRAACLIVFWSGLLTCLKPILFPTEAQRCRREFSHLLLMRKSWIAPELSDRILAIDPDHPWHIAAVAEAAARRSEDAAALAMYRRLPRDGGRWEFFAERGLALRAYNEARLGAAERHLQRALALSPYDVKLNDRLGHLLQVEGRVWEAQPHFFVQLLQGDFGGDQLLGTAACERFFRTDDHLERHSQFHSPPEPLMQLALARTQVAENRPDIGEQVLRALIRQVPDNGEAQGRFGRMLVDVGDREAFLNWRGGLSDEARKHPEVWHAQGLMARRDGMMEAAARCFLEVVELSPNHLAAHIQLAACLQQLGHPDVAEAFRARGSLLAELEGTLNIARADSSPVYIFKIIELLGKLGRHWEAAGWASRFRFLPAVDPAVVDAELRRHLALIGPGGHQQDPATLPARLVDIRDFDLPHWLPLETQESPAESRLAEPSIPWHFVDEAHARGIEFVYYEGTTEQRRMEHIFNTMGGGVGAFDYDLDGWPDLYFAQANNWRDPAPQPQHQDRLFQNRAADTFVDRTSAARLGDARFSHGVAVGDFDQDGFPDLYIGNLEPNRLYHNNGDGTFEERAVEAGVAGDEWTTSSVFADLSGDGLPDLHVLNYTLRDETAAKECGPVGNRKACTPDVLPAAADRCYLNLGDGQFRDISANVATRGELGKGLGVIAWDFEGTGKIGLFVANDTTPDFLLLHDGVDDAGAPRLRDEGVLRGVAYDTDGNVQASMGVAAGDITGDGRIDLLITDFYSSGNCLFSQNSTGLFEDLSHVAGIHQPSLSVLGFGCQFADLDGDGWQDLLVTNGHVDQMTRHGGPDRMPPHVFRNQGGETLDFVAASELGPFFAQGYLGRGMATLDWNRDGRTDAAISQLHGPAALLTNDTPSESKPLTVRLMGTTGCREPIGATVTLLNIAPPQIRLQTGGDGFLVTNEHTHTFAIPRGQESASVEVRWPNGKVQRYDNVPAGGEMLLVEGSSNGLLLRDGLDSGRSTESP